MKSTEKKRILVFSVDALVSEDIEYLKTLPNFKKYLGGGAEVKKIRSIYPSVTYPAHVTMATGCYPEKTGVNSNYSFSLDSKEDSWLWFSDVIRVTDIFTAAHRAGYTTASVFWPVTGKHPDIDWLIDEYWMPRPDDTLRSSFERAGSSPEVLDIIEANRGLLPPSYVMTGRKNFCIHPAVDDFLLKCCCDIIRRFRPEVTFVHNGNIDDGRHKNGVFGDWLYPELVRVDEAIGDLGRSLEAIGELENTDFFLVSDHGQLDIKRTIKPNLLLSRLGLLSADEKGIVTEWKAYCRSNAMSSLVYLHDPDDRETYDYLYRELCRMRDEGIYGFSEVLTREETVGREHLDGGFAFCLESDGYTSFSDSCRGSLIAPLDLSDFRFGHATHGYLPEKGPQPVFCAKGPHIRGGVSLDSRRLVDEAPAYARLLGIELPEAQGSAIEEILI